MTFVACPACRNLALDEPCAVCGGRGLVPCPACNSAGLKGTGGPVAGSLASSLGPPAAQGRARQKQRKRRGGGGNEGGGAAGAPGERAAGTKAANKPRQRRTLSEEHRAKISASMRGKNRKAKSEDHRAAIAASMGRVLASPAVRRRMSEGRRAAGQCCGICGQTGHNRRTCPLLQVSRRPAADDRDGA